MNKMNQIAAVVNYDIGSSLYYLGNMAVIFLIGSVVPREHVKTIVHQRSGYIVLSRQGIASRNIHFRASRRKNLTQISGFCLQMNG